MYREKWIIVISLVLGLAAASLFYLHSTGFFNFSKGADNLAEKKPVQLKKCVVAAKDIDMRTMLSGEMLAVVEVPLELAHPGAVQSVEASVGRVTRDRVYKGEILLEQNLREKDAPSELSFALPEGKRAITIGASVTSAVGNMLRPGDYVDIVVYLNEKLAGEDISFILLPGMLVLAVDTKIYGEQEASGGILGRAGSTAKKNIEYKSVTIAATPRECVKLNLAEAVGRIKLALHSPADTAAGRGEIEIVVLRDMVKDVAVKTRGTAVAVQSRKRKNPGKLNSNTKVTIQKSTSTPKDDIALAKNHFRVIQIMRGVEVQTIEARENEPGGYAAQRGAGK